MYDYIDEYTMRRETLVFWINVYDLMRSENFSEDRALDILDSEGEYRAKYLRPKGFPRCFD